jgi:hypothetical protein
MTSWMGAGFEPEGLAAQNKQRASGRKPGGGDFFKRRQPLVLTRGESSTPAVTPEQAQHQRDRTDALAAAIVWRLLDEERFLSSHLPGYERYRQKTRYRLIPRVW